MVGFEGKTWEKKNVFHNVSFFSLQPLPEVEMEREW